MTMPHTAVPRWVERVLVSPATWLIARLLLVSDFIVGGLEKALNFPAAIVEMQHFGLHPSWLWAGLAVVVELGSPTLIILGRYVWLAAGGLGVLTAVAALVAHHFWTVAGQVKSAEANGFMEDLGLIAGLMLTACLSFLRAPSSHRVPNRPLETGYGVGAQYGSTHVYVQPGDLNAFSRSVIATLGGTGGESHTGQVTPTPSQAITKAIFTPAGNIAAFAFTSPVPYPFGIERTGYLVSDMDGAITSACEHGAALVVGAYLDAVGRDAVVQWPGGIYMQLYSHTVAPNYPALQTVPENRIYVSQQAADLFVNGFVGWSKGQIISDDKAAPGVEIGRPETTFRRIQISSAFGKITVFVTDGALPFPYGHELTGYEVPDVAAALHRGIAQGLQTLVAPFRSQDRTAAIVKFPGGFIAELHTTASY